MFRIRWENLVFQDFVRVQRLPELRKGKLGPTFLFVESGEEGKRNEGTERKRNDVLFFLDINRQTNHGYCFTLSSCSLHRHCLLCPCQTFSFVPTCQLGHSIPNRFIRYTTSSRFRHPQQARQSKNTISVSLCLPAVVETRPFGTSLICC